MRRASAVAALCAAAAACAAPRARPVAVAPYNFEFSALEEGASAVRGGQAFFRVLVDGGFRGRTPAGALAEPKSWQGQLPNGEFSMSFEVWDSSDGVSGVRRPDGLQPPPRRIRVESGYKTSVALKLSDQGRQAFFYITREPQ